MALAKTTHVMSLDIIRKEYARAQENNPVLFRHCFREGLPAINEEHLADAKRHLHDYYKFKQESTWFWQGVDAAVIFLDKSRAR